MRKSEAIRTIETFGVLIDLQYFQAKQVVSEIARQRNNRVITISPKIGRERQRRLRKPHISKYRNCIEIERITLKLNVELYECLTECAKESRTLVNIPDLIDFIIDNECIELANELRIIERRWNCVICSIDSILNFDDVPDKMKTLLFDYKSEMSLFGNDLHLLNRVWTISDEEATRQMLSQDWKEIREADKKQPSWEYIRYVSNKVNRVLDEQNQSTFLTVSNGTTAQTQKAMAKDLNTVKFNLKNSDDSKVIAQLYDFLRNDGLFEADSLSIEDFFDLVGKADFRQFYKEELKYRTKIRHIIHHFEQKGYYPKEWFAQACKLLELETKAIQRHSGISPQWLRKWKKCFSEPKTID